MKMQRHWQSVWQIVNTSQYIYILHSTPHPQRSPSSLSPDWRQGHGDNSPEHSSSSGHLDSTVSCLWRCHLLMNWKTRMWIPSASHFRGTGIRRMFSRNQSAERSSRKNICFLQRRCPLSSLRSHIIKTPTVSTLAFSNYSVLMVAQLTTGL